MKIHMFDNYPNFGDVLNKYIWSGYFGKWIKRNDDIVMFGIGTLLGQINNGAEHIIICGSGAGYEPDLSTIAQDNCKIFFIRGPYSAKVLMQPPETAVTDPAILITEIFKPAAPSGKVLFIPHWETSYNPLWKRACIMAGIEYINPLGEVADIAASISSAKLVITEAMHGAIIADAYRVPWIPVITSANINIFKWNDWAKSHDMTPEFNTISHIGISDFFRDIMSNTEADRKLQDVINDINLKAIPSKEEVFFLKQLFTYIKYKSGERLSLKVGPYIDTITDKMIAGGIKNRRVENAAEILQQLSMLPGQLSEDKVHHHLLSRVHEKISDVQKFLENT